MDKILKILHLEDSSVDAELVEREIKKGGIDFNKRIVSNREDYESALFDFSPDIILSDHSLPSFNSVGALELLKDKNLSIPFILVTATVSEEFAVKMMKNGAADFILKDRLQRLPSAIIQAIEKEYSELEKKKVEQQREFDRNNLKALINNTNDLMWSVDKNFRLITSNKSYNEFVKQVSGRSISNGDDIRERGVSEQQQKRYQTFYERAFAGETFTEIDYTEFPEELWSEVSFYPIRKNGEVVGTACHSHNITERKLAEIERTRMTNELINRNKDLEQFTYIVSHNLRAPVANIMGISSIFQMSELDPQEEKQLVDSLSASVMNLDNVIRDLNYVLQVKHEIRETKETVIFSDLLNDIKLIIFNMIKDEDATILSDFSEINKIFSLKSYLYSIFINLITNSIKYRQPDAKPLIEIRSVKLKNKIRLIFKDNGMGIDLDKRGDQIFGLYKRFHLHIEGKGMGLYMVKMQVGILGGKITVESKINEGTMFSIELDAIK